MFLLLTQYVMCSMLSCLCPIVFPVLFWRVLCSMFIVFCFPCGIQVHLCQLCFPRCFHFPHYPFVYLSHLSSSVLRLVVCCLNVKSRLVTEFYFYCLGSCYSYNSNLAAPSLVLHQPCLVFRFWHQHKITGLLFVKDSVPSLPCLLSGLLHKHTGHSGCDKYNITPHWNSQTIKVLVNLKYI